MRGGTTTPTAGPPVPMQQRYDALVEEMKREHRLRIRKWRSSTSGVAWEVSWSDGARSRLIESPYPRGPMSCAVFLHEVGHHAIGFRTYRLRCEEEYHAWRWGLHAMVERGFAVTPPVHKRVSIALAWAVAKARRRGLRRLPEVLAWFDDPALLELARPRSGPGPRLPDDLVPRHPGEPPTSAFVSRDPSGTLVGRGAAGEGEGGAPAGAAPGRVRAASVDAERPPPVPSADPPPEASPAWWRLGPLFARWRSGDGG